VTQWRAPEPYGSAGAICHGYNSRWNGVEPVSARDVLQGPSSVASNLVTTVNELKSWQAHLVVTLPDSTARIRVS
jgi:hypothetical protein